MEITFLGTSSGVPTRTRNVSSVALRLPQRKEIWLFDCGEATQHQLLRSDLRTSQIRRIFITHMHGDHIFGLMGLLASCGLAGTVSQIDVYGPPTLDRYIASCLRWSVMRLPYKLQVHTVEPGEVFSDGEFTVTCRLLHHRVPAFGYRVTESDRPGRFHVEKAQALGIPFGPLYGQLKQGKTITLADGRTFDGRDFCDPPQRGRSMVYCTDTVFCESAVELAQQADVLIHEATFSHQEADLAFARLHSTSTMAAQVATFAQVKLLFLTHFSARYAPGNPVQVEDLLAEAQAIFPNTRLARDFLRYEIPRNGVMSKEVSCSNPEVLATPSVDKGEPTADQVAQKNTPAIAINRATRQQMQQKLGIDAATANAILERRRQQKFTCLEELERLYPQVAWDTLNVEF
ncbi:ribonuclease Z [Thermosynechococcus sp. QS41]|uniref:ribonuclease Z n=1 Tax=Thermosynechococcus sp. QS41 TaxID=3074101 RepID=UPI002877E867|nr:ribonuclease Z [Thermosynechococcus sp. QS41]WNC61269.1 ribonuclease Z [Thermosynechococcus sp. QS41]